MFFAWLKRFTPRSLYGRAAMILLVPVVSIQLVVGIVFIQRNYEDITRQMTRNLTTGLTWTVAQVQAAPDLAAAQAEVAGLAPALDIGVSLPTVPPAARGERRRFYDVSGRIVARTLREALPDITYIDLASDIRLVRIVLTTNKGPMRIEVPRRQVSASNPHQLLVLMVFTSALMTLIAYLFLRNQVRPIKRLAEAADAFGKGRSVSYRPAGATEVRLAGTAFLDMRARIERQIEQRTQMLSGVSHDLRTPLTRMRLELSMLEDAETAELLRRDVGDMERLIDEFLSFARADALDDPVPTDPAALVRDIVADAGRDGPVRLGRIEGEAGAKVALRPDAVRRAVENLVGNALRYGGSAEVSLTVGERSVRITIEDPGPGIPAAKREEALKPFTRLDAARNQDRGPGVGLGLSIAQDIARRHGGTLRLGDSERLGGLKAELVLAR